MKIKSRKSGTKNNVEVLYDTHGLMSANLTIHAQGSKGLGRVPKIFEGGGGKKTIFFFAQLGGASVNFLPGGHRFRLGGHAP